MPPPTPPEFGYGPANFSSPNDGPEILGGNNPFSMASQINYQNMLRHQMVAQYQQQQPTQYNLPSQMQRQVLTDPRYQYGVAGGQDPSYYNRQAEMNRTAYSGAITSGALGMAAWSGISAPLAAMGVAGGAAIAAPLLMSAPITGMIANRVGQNIERQKYMHSIAADLQQNRDRLGLSGLTYNQASSAGAAIGDRMLGRGGGAMSSFFNKDQMMRINKIGLSEGMLDNSGSIKNYERNVADLISATEDVVKTLQTTIEGGMSIIKEVNQIGFKSLPQVKQQIRAARAAGTSTGLGMQNMLNIGAAGAQAVQGTPWKASVGASMFQMGAVQANAISGTPMGAYAVERAGGVAQAGAAIAGAQMNMMQSGIGQRMAAYAMNADGTINEGRMNTLLTGGVSSYGVVSGANARGAAMGTARTRFGMFQADMMNQLSDAERGQFFSQGFGLWRKGRGGDVRDQAAVFAKMYTNDANQQRVMYESLLGPTGQSNIAATAAAQRFSGANARAMRSPKGWVGQGAAAVGGAVTGGVNSAVDATMATVDAGVGVMGLVAGAAGEWGINTLNTGLRAFGGSKYGMIQPGVSYGDMEQASMVATGAILPSNLAGKFKKLRTKTKNFTDISMFKAAPTVETGINTADIMQRDPSEIQFALQKLNAVQQSGEFSKIAKDRNLMQTLGLDPGSTKNWGFSEVTSAINQINKDVRQPGERFASTRKQYQERGITKNAEFQEAYSNAKAAIYARGKESVGDVLRQVRDTHNFKNVYAQEAETYALQEFKADQFSAVRTVGAQRFDTAGLRARAERAYVDTASGEGWGRKVSNFLEGRRTVEANRFGSPGTSILGNFLAKRDMKRARSDRRFYKSASSRVQARVSLSDEESKRFNKLHDNEAFVNYATSDLESYEALNAADALAYKMRLSSGKSKDEGFSGSEYLGAMKSKEAMTKFLTAHGDMWKKDPKVMMGKIYGDEKGLTDKVIDRFVSYTTDGKAAQMVLTPEIRLGKLTEEFASLSKARGELDNIENKKDREKARRDIDTKRDEKSSELALLQTEIALKDKQGGMSGNNASVASPIMNYWNNRWVL